MSIRYKKFHTLVLWATTGGQYVLAIWPLRHQPMNSMRRGIFFLCFQNFINNKFNGNCSISDAHLAITRRLIRITKNWYHTSIFGEIVFVLIYNIWNATVFTRCCYFGRFMWFRVMDRLFFVNFSLKYVGWSDILHRGKLFSFW